MAQNVRGQSSEPLRMTVFPAAIAYKNARVPRMYLKQNGKMFSRYSRLSRSEELAGEVLIRRKFLRAVERISR